MHPETTGSHLLAIAEQTLQTEIIPNLPEAQRVAALMVASALRMVAREIELRDPAIEADEALNALTGDAAHSAGHTLARAVREGAHDGDSRLHLALWHDAAVRTSISRPSFLSRTERRMVGLVEDEDE